LSAFCRLVWKNSAERAMPYPYSYQDAQWLSG